MKRNKVFDYMKGLGIIAVIVGHCYPHTITAHVIYSFHMPLFFIISGYFLNVDKPVVSSVITDIKRLLLPIIFTISSVCVYRIIAREDIMGGGRMGAFAIGQMWFLLALFWARFFLRIVAYVCYHTSIRINSFTLLIVSVAVSACAYYFHPVLPYWHIYLVLGLTALQFVTLGWVIHKEGCPIFLKVIFIVSWIVALFFGELNMVHYEYKFYPIDVLGGVGGTFVIYYICKGLDFLDQRNSKVSHYISTVLSWCGVHSLLILCIHTFDLKTVHIVYKLSSLNITPLAELIQHIT